MENKIKKMQTSTLENREFVKSLKFGDTFEILIRNNWYHAVVQRPPKENSVVIILLKHTMYIPYIISKIDPKWLCAPKNTNLLWD
jgi:hypothetical protein